MRDVVPPARIRLRAAGAAAVMTAGLLWAGPALTGPAWAVPAHPAATSEVTAGEAPLIDAGSADGRRFRASGRLVGGGGTTCTATVVHGTGQPDPARKALILSNGHCADDSMRTNDVVVDQAAPEGWSFTPAFFHDNAAEHRTFTVERVVYATMKDIDVSLLQLSATYGELAALKVTPWTLADRPVAAGTPLRAAHAPTDGVEEGKRFLRLSTCGATAAAVSLHESSWLWRNFTRTDCLGISGGSSGGAVTTADGTRLVGLLNTVATPGYLGCGLGRPCEGGPAGLVVPKDDTAYATPVDAVASCLDGTGLRLRRAGCRLDRGEQVTVESAGQHTQSHTPQGPARWEARVTPDKAGRHTYVAFKSGPFGVTDCTRPQGYGKPQRLTATGVDHKDPLPPREGLHVLCVAGGPDDTAHGPGWAASFAHPSYAWALVDDTPPTVAPTVDIRSFEGEDGGKRFWVRPVYAPWEITSYKIKYGPKAGTDCAAPEGYRPYLGVPTTLEAAKGPWTYCVIGYDNADNPTPPTPFTVA
ncbi:trypsin-like peptidase domain-containing protein [Streptomyces abikoensis]|uniref:trypsin-like peptidase domain-containing protein n=1 Tax=Streptomyces abikoensis TaxID=97398 RepID=UPI0016772674|nr:trypsin-like peptidase domain-containing protein [Streptomyces abikoensis]GGP44292.1 trypsin [Streptomyces abikoensis]